MRIVKYGLALLFISCCIICFCSNSCRQASAAVDAKDSLIVINIDSLPNGPVPPMDSIYSGYKYIVDKYGSHFNDDVSFGYMVYDENHNFITYDQSLSKVTLYDSTGNFKFYVGKSGQYSYKGEYQTSIARGGAGNGIIYIVDDLHSIVQKYDYHNKYLGYFSISSVDIKRHPELNGMSKGKICDEVIPLPDGRLAVHYAYWAGNLQYNYVLMGRNNKIDATKKTMDKYNGVDKVAILPQSWHYYYNSSLYVKDLSDTVYCISGNRFIPKYVFETKNSLRKLVDAYGVNIIDTEIFKLKKHYYRIGKIQETKNYLFFSFYSFPPCGYINYCCYDKKTGKAYKMFLGGQEPELKFSNQKDTTDYILANCFFYPIINNSSVGWGKKGRVRLYVKH